MKIKSGFVVRQVAGETIALPYGENAKKKMVISLNETGAFLWKLLEQERTVDSLVEALLAEYTVEESVARNSVNAFLQTLRGNGFLEE